MEAPHHKYCKCPDCELFAQMQAHFGTNKPEPNTRPGEALKPPFHFDRYVGGVLMAEGVTIERRGDLASAILAAARIAPKGANGQVPVLVLRPEPNTHPLTQPSELVERPSEAIEVLAGPYRQLDMDGVIVGVSRQAIDETLAYLTQLEAQIAKLQARLEVVPGWSEDADGIACRNDTIKLQDECIAKLQADGDKLAGAATALRDDMLMRAEMRKRRNNGELVVEAGNGVWHRINAALTEWKDRA